MHGLVLIGNWSSLGPFRLLGTSANPTPPRDSRRIDAVIVAAAPPQVRAVPAPLPTEVGPDRPRESLLARTPPLASHAPRHVVDDAPLPAPVPHPAPGPPESGAEAPGVAEDSGRSLPLPDYLPAEALTRQPELIGDVDETLREPLESGFRGRVVIRLYLNQHGDPERVKVLESTLPIAIEGLIVKVFFAARYRPGEIAGQPVMSEMTVDVDLSSTAEIYMPKPPAADSARGGGPPGK